MDNIAIPLVPSIGRARFTVRLRLQWATMFGNKDSDDLAPALRSTSGALSVVA